MRKEPRIQSKKNKECILFEFFATHTDGGIHAKPGTLGPCSAQHARSTRDHPMISITLSNNTLGFTSVLLSIGSV